MIVVGHSEYRDEDGQITLQNRLRGTLRHGLSWYGEMQAQVVVSHQLGKNLDDNYVLLRNLSLPDLPLTTCMILVGPPGIHAIYAGGQHGIYRVKEDTWSRFDTTTRKFRRASPNVVRNTVGLANYLLNFLAERSYRLPAVEAALLFANPRLYVDAAKPAARVVPFDGIEPYTRNLRKSRTILDGEDTQAIVEALLNPEPTVEPDRPDLTAEDVEDVDIEEADMLEELEITAIVEKLRGLLLGMTVRQLVILGILAVMDICILGSLLILVLFYK